MSSAPLLELSFTQLPACLYTTCQPTPTSNPQLLAHNAPLAKYLGIDEDWITSPTGQSLLSGHTTLAHPKSIASAYAGHQFGHINLQLGDGRAHLLGELEATDKQRFDIQLKGSGKTPYSRRGDGRSPLGPVLREYLVSEAMAAMEIPTTRGLAAFATGDTVVREQGAEVGGLLVRVAHSHIRVGSFTLAATQHHKTVQALADYCIKRHFNNAANGLQSNPIQSHSSQHKRPAGPYLELLQNVATRQAKLIAQWMSVGFIHGVMNTDNMLICGQTIDYGPCAFMDTYHPEQVYSYIDSQGRYAFHNQPGIGQWNLIRLAESLLGFMRHLEPKTDETTMIAAVQAVLSQYQVDYQNAYHILMAHKIGLPNLPDTRHLVTNLLTIMQQDQLDYTLTFRYLMSLLDQHNQYLPLLAFTPSLALLNWQKTWLTTVTKLADTDPTYGIDMMRPYNPIFIPRNHLVNKAINHAYRGDMSLFQQLLAATSLPCVYQDKWHDLALAPTAHQRVENTFCGT